MAIGKLSIWWIAPAVAAGLSYALIMFVLAFLLLGPGEGPVSPPITSLFGFIAIPSLAVCALYRSRILMVVCWILATLGDFLLFNSHEMDKFTRTYDFWPRVMIAWFILWIGWQIVLMWVTFNKPKDESV